MDIPSNIPTTLITFFYYRNLYKADDSISATTPLSSPLQGSPIGEFSLSSLYIFVILVISIM
jgi:hypothetical protein